MRRVLLLLSASCRVLLRVRGRGCLLRRAAAGGPRAAVGPRLLAAAGVLLWGPDRRALSPPPAATLSPAAVPWPPCDAAFGRLRAMGAPPGRRRALTRPPCAP